MPSLDGKKYSYDKKGVKAYVKALKKKRKKKEDDYMHQADQGLANGGSGGGQ
tara:strand:+ start:2669 stop:2824 length:156 start_codon:yes stop_codon:yes gene_type:complete